MLIGLDAVSEPFKARRFCYPTYQLRYSLIKFFSPPKNRFMHTRCRTLPVRSISNNDILIVPRSSVGVICTPDRLTAVSNSGKSKLQYLEPNSEFVLRFDISLVFNDGPDLMVLFSI